MFQTDLLAGKRILITGGGGGLGAAMAARREPVFKGE